MTKKIDKAVAERRLKGELKLIEKEMPEDCEIHLVDGNLFSWEGHIVGPKDTPYEDGKFKLKINFTDEYPFKPPSIKFNCKIHHPNISPNGHICLDILQNQWAPSLKIFKVLYSLISLFDDPNPSSPLNGVAARMYRNDRELYNKTVREYVKEMMS